MLKEMLGKKQENLQISLFCAHNSTQFEKLEDSATRKSEFQQLNVVGATNTRTAHNSLYGVM